VDTRLRKLRQGHYDAIIVAAAGMKRLDLADEITDYLHVEQFVPDAGQGTIVLQSRLRNPLCQAFCQVDDAMSHAAADAERAVVRALGANCLSPVGVYARILDGQMTLIAMAAGDKRPDAQQLELHSDQISGRVELAAHLGEVLGRRLLESLHS